MKRFLLSILVACALVLAQAGLAAAAPHPGLDRSFGSQGVADISDQDIQAETQAWAAFANGSTVVLRRKWECDEPDTGCSRNLTMQRYGRNGEFDQTFGASAGAVTLARDISSETEADLAVDSEGRILASWATPDGASVARFDAAGAPDPSFGRGGTVTLGCACGGTFGSVRILLLPGGKILLHHSSLDPQDLERERLTMWRLLPGGAPDSTFGNGSRGISLGFRAGLAPWFFAAAPNGSVIAAGNPQRGKEGHSSFVYRISRSGRLVRGFAANTTRSLQALPDSGDASISSLIVRDGGRIDLLGSDKVTGGGFLLRLRADGRRDPGFGRGGLKRLPWPVLDAAGDSGGGTFVVDEDPARDAGVAHRLFPNGHIDRRFGGSPGVYVFGVPVFNLVQATTLPRGRALVFVGGVSECRGACLQKPRLVMFQEPPLRTGGRHA